MPKKPKYLILQVDHKHAHRWQVRVDSNPHAGPHSLHLKTGQAAVPDCCRHILRNTAKKPCRT